MSVNKYSSLSNYAVLEPRGTLFIFGEDEYDAVVVISQHYEKIKNNQVRLIRPEPTNKKTKTQREKNKLEALNASYNLHKRQLPDKEKLLMETMKRLKTFSAGQSLASFSITSEQITTIRAAIKQHRSSHLEFNCDGKSAKAFLFDIHSQNKNALWKSSFVATADGLELTDFDGGICSFSMRAAIFLTLTNDKDEHFSINLFENYALFTPQDGASIFIRDQDIRKPYTVFFSDQLLSPICFSLA